MKKLTVILILLALIVGAAAIYANYTNAPSSQTPTDGDRVPRGTVFVGELRVALLESFPLQARASMRGSLSTPCVAIENINVTHDEMTFTIAFETSEPRDAACVQVLEPFEESVALDILGLPAGVYTVVAGDQQAQFTLNVDNELLPDGSVPLPEDFEEQKG